MEANADLAMKIGMLMIEEKNPTDALDYLTLAIQSATQDALVCEPHVLGKMYLSRMKCYQSLGLVEHAQKDYVKVLEADPNFI